MADDAPSTSGGPRVIRRPWASNLLLSFASIAAMLILLEGAFRLLDIRADYPRPRRDTVLPGPAGQTARVPHGLVPFATVRSVYASDPRGYFDQGNVVDHVHNSAGWRDIEHTVEKPPGTFRILGLGDSYLWGQGVRYEDIVLTKLGGMLDGLAGELPVETINTGTSGSNTADELALLRARGLAYDPDLVIVFYVLNDVEVSLRGKQPKVEFFANYTSIYQKPDRLSRYSRLWGWARQRYLSTLAARHYLRQGIASFVDDDRKWAQSRDALDEMHGILSASGIHMLVAIFPFFYKLDGDYPFQIVHDVVRSHCELEGIPVLDLRASFREHHGPELWVHPTDQHPNEIAHEIAARAIAAFLKEHPALLVPSRPERAAPASP